MLVPRPTGPAMTPRSRLLVPCVLVAIVVSLSACVKREMVREADWEADFRDLSFPDANNGWVVGEGGMIAHTADGGRTWEKQNGETTVDL
ncbi:hypothetical protein HOI71_02315, partial [Candidatus Poribacteria bacterium]|nr:hypothetical protein [Candidatus Poribacteria bacterium]